ncbi:MAG: hypothetical protein ACYC09_14925 [Bacteroidota bacterium]
MIKDMVFMIDQKDNTRLNVGEVVETAVIFAVGIICLIVIVLS